MVKQARGGTSRDNRLRVLVTPIWNFGWPAMLKGFFDRVFLPGVSFKLVDGKVQPALSNIRKLAVVCTYGGARWRAFVLGDPPRKNAGGWLRIVMHPAASFDYLALYDMNRADDALHRAKAAGKGRTVLDDGGTHLRAQTYAGARNGRH